MKEDRVKEAYNEIDLYEYLRVIWKWRWLIVIGLIVATLAAIPAAYLMRTYESQGVLRLSESLQPSDVTQTSEKGSKEISSHPVCLIPFSTAFMISCSGLVLIGRLT